ncbi:TIGR02391 family protein [Kitasatospora sp. HPMI-4]|uniref:TIGR02391 family protein n=1 Tax=Kitasatospora sp. HPMI-4 TaxID=3448443 RepID=UPI003F1CA912
MEQIRDPQWAVDRLRNFHQAILDYKSSFDSESSKISIAHAYSVVASQEPTAKLIMRRVNPEFWDFNIKHYDLGFAPTLLPTAIELTINSIGIIQDADEVARHLGPSGPKLPASSLHPWVWDSAKSLWETKHYREAVQTAATSINYHLQRRSGRMDVSDLDLLNQLLSEKAPEPGKPRLRWLADPMTDEFKSMMGGLRGMSQGIFQCIRNRATHDVTPLAEAEALERLTAMSLLCNLLDKCQLVKA